MKKRISLLWAAIALMGILVRPVPAAAATLSSKAGAVTIASTYLNVRSGASMSASVVATLKRGSYIALLSKSGSWWQVEYGKGRYGYCHADYITIVQGSPVTVATQTGSLNIRSGPGTSYSKTASLAKGETVLLLTTSGGWSRILYHGTNTGYLSAIYQYLKQGKPVLFGAQNAYGGQHWVVITGFTGGSLTAGNFTINDPGSNTRTTLQQFLNAYPNFYKYFYYN